MRESVDIPAVIGSYFDTARPTRIGVAVSGGGDSVALMHGISEAFRDHSVGLYAATVDHGLRAESRFEAQKTGEQAAMLGFEHSTLEWKNWSGGGNLQDQARRARYELLANWAKTNQISCVAVGHTADDQAETVLMRLARSSGVRGLAAIRPRRIVHGVTFCRPLLGVSRASLRQYLVDRGISWIDDPSNEDLRFDRVRVRAAIETLTELGLKIENLATVAENMQSAADALDWYTFLAARDLVSIRNGSILLDHRGFRILPAEIARRLIENSVGWITGYPYPMRRASMDRFVTAIRAGDRTTLGGVFASYREGAIWLTREYEAVRQQRVASDQLWDSRWLARGPGLEQTELRALGPKGLTQCPQWRFSGLPRAALLSSPAIWHGDQVIAAPAAGKPGAWHIELLSDDESFFSRILSH